MLYNVTGLPQSVEQSADLETMHAHFNQISILVV